MSDTDVSAPVKPPIPPAHSSDGLRRAAKCVYIAMDKRVADDLADRLVWAADRIDHLEKLIGGA